VKLKWIQNKTSDIFQLSQLMKNC